MMQTMHVRSAIFLFVWLLSQTAGFNINNYQLNKAKTRYAEVVARGNNRNDVNSNEKLIQRRIHSISRPIALNMGGNNNAIGRRVQHKDIVIIGGGLAGLSTALYISQIDPDRRVTIIDREGFNKDSKKSTTVSSFAAAGMLAPQSERLPKGKLLELCLASRRMYPGFCNLVETLAQESGEDGMPYLLRSDEGKNVNMEPWDVGYVHSGGFLAPAFAGDAVATWAPPEDSGSAVWLDSTQVRELEPNLHPEVIGGWWFPEDSSVDARRLTCSLVAACVGMGVEFLNGENYEVTSLDLVDGSCEGMWLKNGRYLRSKSVLVANGAWMRTLLPVPIEPHKGQSLSLQMPPNRPPILRRVLFAQDSYVVPKADGSIIIGATVEAGSFDGDITPTGMIHILTHALQLVPGLADLPIKETWAGLRPTTPDKGPILGQTPWDNLFLAGGYWRNGVLLAPKTGQLLAKLICSSRDDDNDDTLDADEKGLLDAFRWNRFTSEEGGAALAASTRYAASMHPIHSRRSGAGVAAAVGTELGFYATASSASDERKRDRESLWSFDGNTDSDDDAFERAASLGKQDAAAYSFGEESAPPKKGNDKKTFSLEEFVNTNTMESKLFDDSTSFEAGEEDSTDIKSIYQSIQDRKAQTKVPEKAVDDGDDDRPDPGFRIFHHDEETDEKRMVPPYTAPAEFLKMIEKEKGGKEVEQAIESVSSQSTGKSVAPSDINEEDEYNEKTYDGYQAIQQANSRGTREEELQAMKVSRQKNRLGQSDIDISAIGAQRIENVSSLSSSPPASNKSDDKKDAPSTDADTLSMYQAIKDRKSKTKIDLPGDESKNEEKPDPGFRIYHIDSETGEQRMVPPYTTPGEFQRMIEEEKKANNSTSTVVDDASKGEEEVQEVKTSLDVEQLNGDSGSSDDDYDEKTYDGYQIIQSANSRQTREEELEAMREARQSNRLGKSDQDKEP